MDREYSDIVEAFLSTVSAKIGFILVGVLLTPLLVRVLGSSGYGDYAFIVSVFTVLMVFANAGIFDGTRKFLGEDRPVAEWTDHVFAYFARISVITGVTTAFFLIAATHVGLAQLVVDPYMERYLYLAAGVILARQFYYTIRGVLLGLGLEHYGEPLRVIKQVLFALLGLPLAYIGYGVAGVLAGYATAHIVIGIVGLFVVARRINLSAVFRSSPPEFPSTDILSYSIWTTALMLSVLSLYHVDILLLQPLTSSEETGYYRAALIIAEFLWLAPVALQLVLLQSVSRLWTEDERMKVTRIASQSTRYTLLITVLMAIGIAVLAEPFVSIYFGSDFLPAVEPVLILLPGAVGFAAARPIYTIGQGIGKLRILVYATLSVATLNLVLNVLLIPRYGMHGAAIATSTSYLLMFVAHSTAARKIGFNPNGDLRIGRICVSALLTFPVLWYAASAIGSPILSLVVVPPIGLLIYFTMAFMTNAITRDEVKTAIEILLNPI